MLPRTRRAPGTPSGATLLRFAAVLAAARALAERLLRSLLRQVQEHVRAGDRDVHRLEAAETVPDDDRLALLGGGDRIVEPAQPQMAERRIGDRPQAGKGAGTGR